MYVTKKRYLVILQSYHFALKLRMYFVTQDFPVFCIISISVLHKCLHDRRGLEALRSES